MSHVPPSFFISVLTKPNIILSTYKYPARQCQPLVLVDSVRTIILTITTSGLRFGGLNLLRIGKYYISLFHVSKQIDHIKPFSSKISLNYNLLTCCLHVSFEVSIFIISIMYTLVFLALFIFQIYYRVYVKMTLGFHSTTGQQEPKVHKTYFI